MGTNYTIKPGDTLSEIAKAVGTTVASLVSANGISIPNLIKAGSNLVIPTGNGSGNSALNDYVTKKALGGQVTAAEKAVAGYGDFDFSKQDEYNSIYDQYKNRKDFSYDFNADAFYQQFKDKYIQQGKMAMADTMGQAAAMTGGYGNSYAASVGNQAYQKSLENLNDIIPELYQMARDKYDQEGQDMLNMMALLGDERNFEYGKWGDGYNRLVADRDYISGRYDKAIADEQWQKNYDLSARELAMAEEAWELENKGNTSSGSSGSSYSGSSGGSGSGSSGSKTDEYLDASLFKGYDAGDWEAYFANIRQTEGSSAANEELNLFTKKGLIPTNMVVFAAIGARGKLGH